MFRRRRFHPTHQQLLPIYLFYLLGMSVTQLSGPTHDYWES